MDMEYGSWDQNRQVNLDALQKVRRDYMVITTSLKNFVAD